MLARRYQALSAAIAFFLATHLLALAAMGLLLRPGIDAFAFAPVERMSYVAAHPWLFRLGWLPWQASALSDLWVCLALGRWLGARAGRRGSGWAWASLALMLGAAVGEQWAEWRLCTSFIDVARAGDLAGFEAGWRQYTWLTGVWGAGLYTLMTIAWMLAVRRAAGGGAWGGRAEGALLLVLVTAATTTHLAIGGDPQARAYFAAASAASAVAFPALCLWILGAAGRLGELARQDLPDPLDGHAALRWPRARGLRWASSLASEGARDVLRWLSRVVGIPVLRSDVTDVVYLSWMVPIERVAHLVPSLPLHDLGGLTPLSILTYRHGGFGPRLLGPLRRLFPSPIQSNWRLYAAPDGAREPSVVFLKTLIDQPFFALMSRLLSDGLPSHLPSVASHERHAQIVRTILDPGDGSAPDLRASVVEGERRELPEAFRRLGSTWDLVIAYLVPQGVAVRAHPAVGLTSLSPIRLEPTEILPASVIGEIESAWLAPIVEGLEPLAFTIPSLRFEALGERWIRNADSH